jgi:N-acetylmuramoyl-L-alanine amidase
LASTRHNGIAVVLCALLIACALTTACPAALASGGSDSLGARSCSTDWYFAEGTTRAGFTTYIAIMNPNDAADVTFTYMPGSGDPVVRTHRVAATSRFTIDISLDVGPGRDVATFVHSTVPVVAERPMYFIYQGRWDGGHDSLGATSLAKQWFFAEGTTRADFVTYLAVLNPNADASDVTFTYLLGSGQPVVRKHPVAAKSRFTVDVAADLGSEYQERDVSTVVDSTLPVVAERPMYFNYQGKWDGGHDSLGARSLSTEWDFAEGTTRRDFVTYLTIANPGEADASVSCMYSFGYGQTREVSHAVPGNSRFTIDVSADVGPEQDVSTTIRSNVPVAAERPMYFNYMGKWDGGHDSLGATSPGDIWEFAEGTTRTGYATYLAILNPTDGPVSVTITYALASGDPIWCSHLVQPHCRYTLDVSSDVGGGQDVAAFVRGSNVVVERPMYFSAPGKGVSICIDAGHSGHDGTEVDPATGLNVGDNTGAEGELQQNWDLAVKARQLLEDAGYTVVFTKQSVNDYLSLKQRADIGNTCALMVRLHHDPSGFTGVMRPPAGAARCPTSDPGRITVVDPRVAVESDRLAHAIAPRMGLAVRDDTGGTSQGNSTPAGHPTCLIGSLLSKVPIVCIENKYSTSDDYVSGLVEGITAYLSK